MKIAVAGHICLDIIPDWKKGKLSDLSPGETLEMKGVKISTGGAVPNTGLALNKLGNQVTLIGKIGADPIGQIIENYLSQESHNLINNLIISQKETSSYTVVISPPDTDRLFLHDPGPNNTFAINDIDFKLIKSYKIFHFGYPSLMKMFYRHDGIELKEMFQKARDNNLVTSLDLAKPDPNSEAGSVDWKSILAGALPYVDIFLPSIDELTFMLNRGAYVNIFENKTQKLSLDFINKLADQLLGWGTKIVVIKLGVKGIYMQSRELNSETCSLMSELIEIDKWSESRLYSSNFEVKVAGTTGAGDAAVAGFLTSFVQGYSPEKALTVAAATGACSVEKIDATEGILPLNKINERINSGWKLCKPGMDISSWHHKNQGVWNHSND